MLLVGCYTPERGQGAGVAVVATEAGVPVRVERVVPAASPSFLARHPTRPVLYAVGETETDTGTIAAWSTSGDAPDAPLGAVVDSGGADPCHLTVDSTGRFLVTVNYTGGSIAVHRLDGGGAILERTDLVHHDRHGDHERQDGGHPHQVRALPGGALLVTDLGGDAIYRYRLRDGKLIADGLIEAPARSGPRHLVQVGDAWLVTAELSTQVLVYDADWRLVGQVPATRSTGECLVSELAVGGDFLYVANRGVDTVSVFRLGAELPEYVTEVPTGAWPRHIAVVGPHLHVANQKSDELTTMLIDPATGVPAVVSTLAVPSPTCVLAP
ncbi:6-phosphogluconolactonase (cycloisomerase 2 family) [Allocatelliglobosispora scoriae]|uniref:6-phosphogluconolactonase (Cycloisomerase 2 family) n=1 Tax=Allocatelliglobosispora scoriae TaxID=643052 RepID=A0A841BLH1_9ACTN|nr:beta-propeller fold lactonase family protein [Allocatelliglobosispora scoriae]MBB5867592.1 6-phosphogluconolactonase (cycloisomerase 2 family) [Allocatelliglobosispora scoriae]